MNAPRYDFKILDLVKTVDGDTCDLVVDVGFRATLTQRIRLAIVDTPERGQPGFKEATLFLKSWVETALLSGCELRLRTYVEDPWKRWVADIYRLDTGETVSSALLYAGLAEVW